MVLMHGFLHLSQLTEQTYVTLKGELTLEEGNFATILILVWSNVYTS